jgi:hypothetical protein
MLELVELADVLVKWMPELLQTLQEHETLRHTSVTRRLGSKPDRGNKKIASANAVGYCLKEALCKYQRLSSLCGANEGHGLIDYGTTA